jgi:hypothetical protein
VLDGANLYRSDITALLANGAAALQLNDVIGASNSRSHVLRVTNPLNPENLSLYSSRLPTNRANAYALPQSGKLTPNKLVYDARGCGPALNFTVENSGQLDDELIKNVVEFALAGGRVDNVPCVQQPRFDVNGTITRFPQVRANPAGLQAGLPVP